MTSRAWWRRPGALTGLAVLALLGLIAVVGPWMLPDPVAQPDVIGGANLAPGAGHLLGTDQLSRDVLARVVSGARVSLAVALLSVALAVSLGTLVGLVSGYAGGWVDTLLMRLVDGALAIPRLFLLLLLLAAWDRVPLLALVLVIGCTGWLGTSRIVRAEVRRVAAEPFVAGARALGAGRARIVFRHVLPNALGPVIVAATLGVGNVILIEAGLSYLGLGVQGPAGMLLGDDAPSGQFQYFALNTPSISIAGGTDEIQRNIIGERILGLPPEPRPDKEAVFRELLHN